jgi:DNA polymerase-3 subunit delta'
MPFRDVVGHRRLVGLLARSVQLGTVPPSLILAGPAGVGKRLVAVATAQAFNCLATRAGPPGSPDEGAGRDACGTCAICRRIARGLHPDVPIVEPGDGGAIKIDVIRDVIDRAAYRPFEGRRRVVIVDDADTLVHAAQNALLKTLEEPPPSSLFLLVTSRPDLLLPTVRSRCPQLRFRPLAAADVVAVLTAHGRSEAEARAVSALADGSVGRALEASGDEFVDARDVALRVLGLAGRVDPRRRIEVAKELLVKTGGGGAGDRDQLAVHLRAMASLLRDVALAGTGADRRALANADVLPAIESLSMFRGERGVQAFRSVDRGLAALQGNAGVKIVADWVVMQL